jgi:hypothetical protein
MLQELTNTRSIVTEGLDAETSQEDASNVQVWEPGLKASRMHGCSLLDARRDTRAMLPSRQFGAALKLRLPAWHKPYAEALLTNEPQTLAKLLAASEIAFCERILELGDENVSDERADISRAFDVVLDLKAKTSSQISTGLSAGTQLDVKATSILRFRSANESA